MADVHDAIPDDAIYLVDAFERVFRKQRPDWQTITQRCNNAALAIVAANDVTPNDNARSEECRRELTDATIALDDAHFRANDWLRSHVGDGTLAAFVRNPVTDKLFRLPRTGWGMVLEKSAIETNFVGPDDVEAPGPDTVIDGDRRPVFFKTAEFQQLLEAEESPSLSETLQPVDYRTGYPGRPSVQHLVKVEIDRRIDDASYVSTEQISSEAEALSAWLLATYQVELTGKSIENRHRKVLRTLVETRK